MGNILKQLIKCLFHGYWLTAVWVMGYRPRVNGHLRDPAFWPAIARATWDLIATVEMIDLQRLSSLFFVFPGEEVYKAGDFTENWKVPIKVAQEMKLKLDFLKGSKSS
ncbi:hypothetical protein SASPL_156037 [Salvia splendens]|uniref:Uncharacterized protein n=1 Tax=Salvia splendens TaxID=180675 RepID=A0A8X8VXC4_SALSN|nr:hypothetical protein SASPL_156037 [Salvia splendens]